MARGYLAGLTFYLLLLGAGIPTTRAQAETYIVKGHMIEVQLIPEKSVIRLGETIRVTFKIRNRSPQELHLEIGAEPFSSYKRTGFRFEARRDDGLKVLPPPYDDPGNGDALILGRVLAAGKSDAVDLLLPKMLTFSQPGRYTLLCETELAIEPSLGKGDEITTVASAVLTILPADYRAMGQVIDRLGLAATIDTGKRPDIPTAMQQATEALGTIEDGRVIPWLVKMFQMRNANRKYEAIEMLAKFNTSIAFKTLKLGLAVRSSELDDCSTLEAAVENVRAIRVATVYALANSPCPEALPLVKSLLHDPIDEVREAIVSALMENKTSESTTMLRIMAHDPSPKIRNMVADYLNPNIIHVPR